MDDIVTMLRKEWEYGNAGRPTDYEMYESAADEIERLRTALQLAVGELSTHDTHRLYSPDQLYQQFLDEARRG